MQEVLQGDLDVSVGCQGRSHGYQEIETISERVGLQDLHKEAETKNVAQSSLQLNYSVYFTKQDAIIEDKGKLIKMNYREIKRP